MYSTKARVLTRRCLYQQNDSTRLEYLLADVSISKQLHNDSTKARVLTRQRLESLFQEGLSHHLPFLWVLTQRRLECSLGDNVRVLT